MPAASLDALQKVTNATKSARGSFTFVALATMSTVAAVVEEHATVIVKATAASISLVRTARASI